MKFGTKAETLSKLFPRIGPARVLPSTFFTVAEWRAAPDACLLRAHSAGAQTAHKSFIVRSSAVAEDTADSSNAGRFLSLPNISSDALRSAIERVIGSYEEPSAVGDQVLIQPMLEDVALAGVAFSRDPSTGSHYIVVNYDDTRGDTAAVTGGRAANLKTYVHSKEGDHKAPAFLDGIIGLVRELELRFEHDALDIEFAVDRSGQLYLFQVRPLPQMGTAIDAREHRALLEATARKISAGMRPHPYLHGFRTVYGVMPDWNPAEIIGIRPRPLALSLYRDLVTDSIWAYQRNNYGYKNLRSFALMVHFFSLPYIDVRVSVNSFIPRDVEKGLADRLANYYIDRLIEAPALHDKIEFEVVFSCYTLDLKERLARLTGAGFEDQDTRALADSLRRLTNRIIHRENGLWRADADKLRILQERHAEILGADMDEIDRIYWLLEDCKRYGTLPFAGLARAAFIAVQMLRSLVTVGILSQAEYDQFMSGLNTISSKMSRDLEQLDRATFLAQYGHLRPGTYDILSPRYDEQPDLYFEWGKTPKRKAGETRPFSLSLTQMRNIKQLLDEHELDHDVVGLFEFIQSAIELREYAKFLFTRNLSDALALLQRFGERHGLTSDDLSYADIGIIGELHVAGLDHRDVLLKSIEQGRSLYAKAQRITLPPLITSVDDVWSFHVPSSEPNFITQKAVTAPVKGHKQTAALAGAIVAIENADPGFDWIFSHPIKGFITAYGGANSHMAIRAHELGLPAVIGAGEALYRQWSAASMLQIDCAGRRVNVLR